jgi:uncharacterized alpha-E superfamily protein
MAGLTQSLGSPGNEWHSTLLAAGCADNYFQKYTEATAEGVSDFLMRDPDNRSSILACLETARRNARSVRTALTIDVWETLNDSWLELRAWSQRAASTESQLQLLDWVKHRSMLINGACLGTMLRSEAFYFAQLGTFLERVDNTARILDFKYHVLLPQADAIGGALDHCHWESILRAVSALRAYHLLYHERLAPWRIAELLILRSEMPRSLVACFGQVEVYLSALAQGSGGRRGECHRRAGHLHARLRFGRIDAIFESGLHEFLTEMIDESIDLGRDVSEFYGLG